MPSNLAIVHVLADRLLGRPLPPPVATIFHDIRTILDHHPRELYELYKEDQEARCIYFFSQQEFRTSPTAGNDDGKMCPPVRTAYGGVWKLSGRGKLLKSTDVAGKMVTMMFYERRRVGGMEKGLKTNWGLQEFTVLVGPNKFSKLAVYRLYKFTNAAARQGQNPQQQANGAHHNHVPAAALAIPYLHAPAAVVAVADHHAPSTSSAAASYAAGSSSATVGHAPSSWAPLPDSTNSQVQQDDTKLPVPVADYSQFAPSSSDQEAPSQPQLVLPVVGDEDYMSAMVTNDLVDGSAADGIIDTFGDLVLVDGSEIAYSMDELTGTEDPSSGDGNSLARGRQQDI